MGTLPITSILAVNGTGGYHVVYQIEAGSYEFKVAPVK